MQMRRKKLVFMASQLETRVAKIREDLLRGDHSPESQVDIEPRELLRAITATLLALRKDQGWTNAQTLELVRRDLAVFGG